MTQWLQCLQAVQGEGVKDFQEKEYFRMFVSNFEEMEEDDKEVIFSVEEEG